MPTIRATWDEEAKVWVAKSDDVPGLATEADSLDALFAKLHVIVPELLELNASGQPVHSPFELRAGADDPRRFPRR